MDIVFRIALRPDSISGEVIGVFPFSLFVWSFGVLEYWSIGILGWLIIPNNKSP
jgi:hypothetical protein